MMDFFGILVYVNVNVINLSICECKCDKSCDVGESLDYANCQSRKKLIDKLVEECSEDIDGNEMIYYVTINDHEKSMQLLYHTHSVVSHNFCNIYEHWECIYLFLLACHKK